MTAELSAVVPAVAWALLNFLWKGALIGAACAALLRLLPATACRQRYLMLCLAQLSCLASVLLETGLSIATATAPASAGHALGGMIGSRASSIFPAAAMPWLVACWLTGVMAMGARLVSGLCWTRSLVAQASVGHTRWQASVSSLALRCGICRPVLLRVADGHHGPLTTGWWRPVIIVPGAFLLSMPPQMLEALLAHEIAHIKRMDYLINLLQNMIEALLFFHPVVWWLSRHIRIERELIADELAGALTGEPRQLALALERLSHGQAGRNAAAVPLRAAGGELLERVKRLARPATRIQAKAMTSALPAMMAALAMTAALAAGSRFAPLAPPLASTTPATSNHRGNTLPDAVQDGEASMLGRLLESNHVAVLDSRSGRVLLQKDADAVVPIASLTKLVTAMVVLDARPDLDRVVRIEQQHVSALRQVRSSLPEGSRVSLRSLMQLALASSDNRAAYALAQSYPGGLSAFRQAAGAKIAALGLAHTMLDDPTGLSPLNTSTALELAAIAGAAAGYPDIARYTTNPAGAIRIAGQRVAYRNTNQLVGKKGWDIALSKTGFTPAAGRCLIMRLKSPSQDVTLVLLDGARPDAMERDAHSIRRLLAAIPQQPQQQQTG
ncbi:M56 family metallopeptidase [Herbaspirillum sp. NPDC087042]|uniref:M56 family metallopeptidase n=1 Tax=Herbaspirillum sp. NPDC087042 TaxID=3364004 RepID=UPI00381D7EA3